MRANSTLLLFRHHHQQSTSLHGARAQTEDRSERAHADAGISSARACPSSRGCSVALRPPPKAQGASVNVERSFRYILQLKQEGRGVRMCW
ncbi:hypothetical protein AAFF_G00398640 [Aldrovandia affinis]|uniref:Uncharacterized protein n=1 Tax=Aldrovandia affinis TaxID=143900 RepID=A0AAD7WKN0_9TELE|nr:hypothetical protein AAFF_G00398640 [Aldrovandia affinis]